LYLLPDLGAVSGWKEVQIWQESAGLQNTVVPALLPLATKQNVFLQRSILDPGQLWDIGHGTLQPQKSLSASFMETSFNSVYFITSGFKWNCCKIYMYENVHLHGQKLHLVIRYRVNVCIVII